MTVLIALGCDGGVAAEKQRGKDRERLFQKLISAKRSDLSKARDERDSAQSRERSRYFCEKKDLVPYGLESTSVKEEKYRSQKLAYERHLEIEREIDLAYERRVVAIIQSYNSRLTAMVDEEE